MPTIPTVYQWCPQEQRDVVKMAGNSTCRRREKLPHYCHTPELGAFLRQTWYNAPLLAPSLDGGCLTLFDYTSYFVTVGSSNMGQLRLSGNIQVFGNFLGLSCPRGILVSGSYAPIPGLMFSLSCCLVALVFLSRCNQDVFSISVCQAVPNQNMQRRQRLSAVKSVTGLQGYSWLRAGSIRWLTKMTRGAALHRHLEEAGGRSSTVC